MRQHISINQLNELSDKGKERLREWWKPQQGDNFTDEKFGFSYDVSRTLTLAKELPLLSIGQMIELLSENLMEHNNKVFMDEDDAGELEELSIYNLADGCFKLDGCFKSSEETGLCDALWEAVKEILEK